MDKVTLQSIMMKYIEADEKLAEAQIKFAPLELEYQTALDQATLNAPGASQAIREAQARETMRVDQRELFEKYNETYLEVRLARQRYQTLQKVADILRTIEYSGGV